MATSIIEVSGKPKTYGALTRLQKYIEKPRDTVGRDDAPPEAWTAALADIRPLITRENYASWLVPARVRQDGDRLLIGAPDEFSRFWLENRLDGQIRAALERTGYGGVVPAYELRPEADRVATADAPRRIIGRDDWAAYTKAHLDERDITPRQGKQSDRYNSVLANHYVLTATPAWFTDHPEQKEAWMQHSVDFVAQLHGEEQILGAVVHEHQSSPHLHVVAIPIDDRGHLNAGAFTRTREQLEALHTAYNRYLRDHGLQLDRGQNARLERQLAAAPPAVRRMTLHVDEIPLAEVLERLEADRDTRDPDRWVLGDRLIQVAEDGHTFTEFGPRGVAEGRGAIDLVTRLRQEGRTPVEQYDLAVSYLAALHAERIPGGAPPLVPAAPDPVPRPPLERQSIPFGAASRWEPGQFIVVDSVPDAQAVAASARGWGRVAVVDRPDALPVDELDEAVARGWMVDVASRSDALWRAIHGRYADLGEAGSRQIWQSRAPGTGAVRAVETGREPEHEHDRDDGALMMGL